MRIQGNVTNDLKSKSFGIWVNSNVIFPSKTYSLLIDYTWGIRNGTMQPAVSKGSHSFYYINGVDKLILKAVANDKVCFYITNLEPGPIDITLKGMYLYEGAYINPPLYVSPDVNPHMSIMYKERFYEKQWESYPMTRTTSTIGWQRIYQIPCTINNSGIFVRSRFWGILYVSKFYNNARDSFTIVKFALAKENVENDTYAYIEAEAYGGATDSINNNIWPFSKYRISRDPNTGIYYLDGYHATTKNENVFFYLKDWQSQATPKDLYLNSVMKDPLNESGYKNYVSGQYLNFRYLETIPANQESILEKNITMKLTKI